MKNLISGTFLILLLTLLRCSNQPESSRPNIILIMADDLGYNDLSCYRVKNKQMGQKSPTCVTPNIDRLAGEGIMFTDFYCGAAVCSPSRSSLLTGRNCTRVGIYNWIPGNQPMHLRKEEITLAELLKSAGYRTAHFGKWHLTSEGMEQPLPVDQGYEYAFFTYNNANPSHRDPVNFFKNREPVGPLQGYSCHLVMDEVLHWLNKNEGIEEPFYMNIWFNEPHNKVAAPEELAGRHTYHEEYYGCIENMDMAVGRLITYLEKKGLDNHTMIIFTSDNGSLVVGSNDPLRGEKTFNYEGGLRVPFIIRWPDKTPPGVTSEIAGSFTDLLPSVAALTGTHFPDDRVVDGIDISPVFLNPEEEFQREKPIFFFRYFHDPVCMLRDGDWVLLGYRDPPPPPVRDYDQRALAKLKPEEGEGPGSMWNFQPAHMEYIKEAAPRYFELYDISEDISQESDLSSRYPELVEKMKTQMLILRMEMIEEGGDWYAEN